MLPVLILVRMVFSAHAGDLTLRELEQKINNLDKLEQNVERLQKEVMHSERCATKILVRGKKRSGRTIFGRLKLVRRDQIWLSKLVRPDQKWSGVEYRRNL